MSNVAVLVQKLIDAGASAPEAAAIVAEAFVAGVQAAPQYGDESAERRRVSDRERKRAQRDRLRNSAESADRGSKERSPTPPKENTTPPETANAVSSPKPTRRKPKVPLPDGWTPSQANVATIQANGLTAREIGQQLLKFQNHAKQDDRRCVDWDAAFRNWCLKALEFMGREVVPAATSERNPETAPGFDVAFDSPEMDAWAAYERATGKSYPRNKSGGWRFPSQWPPGFIPSRREAMTQEAAE